VNKFAMCMIAAATLGCWSNSQSEGESATALSSMGSMASTGPTGEQPARFVSSTLKFAMAELGRTSPGARLNAVPAHGRMASLKALKDHPKLWAVSSALISLPASGAQEFEISIPVTHASQRLLPPSDRRLADAAYQLASIR
jgi:hypothetical protein